GRGLPPPGSRTCWPPRSCEAVSALAAALRRRLLLLRRRLLLRGGLLRRRLLLGRGLRPRGRLGRGGGGPGPRLRGGLGLGGDLRLAVARGLRRGGVLGDVSGVGRGLLPRLGLRGGPPSRLRLHPPRHRP